jgi:hypothetical protein
LEDDAFEDEVEVEEEETLALTVELLLLELLETP